MPHDANDQRRASTLLRTARLGSHVESLRDFLCLRSEEIFRWRVSEANEDDRFDTMTAAARFAFRRPRLGRLQNGVCRAGVGVWGRALGSEMWSACQRDWVAALLRLFLDSYWQGGLAWLLHYGKWRDPRVTVQIV